MRKIFLHIGLPKTGTSYLQSSFAINAIKYKEYGLIYNDYENNFNGAKLGDTTAGNALRLAKTLDNNIIKNIEPYVLTDFFNSLDNNYDHLFSSEYLSVVSLASLKNFINNFDKNFKFILIAFVRDPVENVISAYLQGLKSNKNDIESFNILCVDFVSQIKRRFNLLIGLRQHIKLFNYDFKKYSLIHCLDNLIFSKLISIHPEKKIINPSLNYQKSEIVRLLNNFNINFKTEELDKYIYSSKTDIDQIKTFPISKSLREKIYKDLSAEIKEINQMLPDDEQIKVTSGDCGDTEYVPLFTNNDIDFLKRTIGISISNEERLLLNKKLSPYSLSPKLPADFNVLDYLLLNPDVLRSNLDPVEHYLRHGKEEFRQYNRKLKITQTTNLNFDRSTLPDSRIRRIIKKYILKLKLIFLKLQLVLNKLL
jgi:translation initiation factor 2 beta subunit (eIF-2beta)/eIF-5